jgi:hypothetical protein
MASSRCFDVWGGLVQIGNLAIPDALIEIEAVAALDG